MNIITINGQTIVINGDASNVQMTGDSITIDGVTVASGLSGIVKVEWSGPAVNVSSKANLTITGNVEGEAKAGANLTCGNVGGNVDVGNNASVNDVAGYVSSGNTVNAGTIKGSVSAGNKVTYSGK